MDDNDRSLTDIYNKPTSPQTSSADVRAGQVQRRRANPHVESEPDEDEAFEDDQRPVDPQRRSMKPVASRRPVTVVAGTPSRKRPRSPVRRQKLSEDDQDDPVDLRIRQADSKAAPRPVPDDGQDDGTEDESVGQRDRSRHSSSRPIDFQRVNEKARHLVAMRAPRKVQVRRAWSNESVARLVEYIEKHDFATSWAKIESQDDPLLEGRDQVALKDKARNLKVDFLK